MSFLWTYKRLFIAKRSSYSYSSLCEAIQRGNNSFVDRVLFFFFHHLLKHDYCL